MLASFFGADAIPFSVSYVGLPGVTRSYDSFTAAADEDALSRIWLGFHFSFDVIAGDALGRSVGAHVFQNFLLPRSSPPPGGSAAPILVAWKHIVAVGDAGIASGSNQRADATAADLSIGVCLASADATSNRAVFETGSTEASGVYSDGRPQRGAHILDDDFGSLDLWQQRLACVP